MYKKLAIIGLAFVIVDQLIKRMISQAIELNSQVEIIPDFFYLANVHNEGGAWSILSGQVWFLIAVGFFALFFIFFSFIKGKDLSTIEIVVFACLMGGVIGNLIDRIVHGYVIDYLSFNIFGYDFPVFNLADMGIVLSVGFLLLWTIKEEVCKKSESMKT